MYANERAIASVAPASSGVACTCGGFHFQRGGKGEIGGMLCNLASERLRAITDGRIRIIRAEYVRVCDGVGR